MIGHHVRFRENDDLPLWQGPATKKKPPFCNARALITRKIMRSRDAQCNTGNNLKAGVNQPRSQGLFLGPANKPGKRPWERGWG